MSVSPPRATCCLIWDSYFINPSVQCSVDSLFLTFSLGEPTHGNAWPRAPFRHGFPASSRTRCPPDWLHERAAELWRATEPHVREASRIGPEHADLFGQYCSVVSELRNLSRIVAVEGAVVAGSATAAVKLAARVRGTHPCLPAVLGST